MARDPRRCGYLATTWTVPLLAHYLAAHDGIEVSHRTLRRRLHEAGWRWKRPPENSDARANRDPPQPGQSGSESAAARVTT